MFSGISIAYLLSLIAAIAVFTIIAWRNLPFALALLFGLLPTYLIRFHIGPLPTTFLEVMVVIIIIRWIIHVACSMKHVANEKTLSVNDTWYMIYATWKQHQSLFIATALFLLAATISVFTSVNIRAALGEWKAFYIEPVLIFLVLITTLKTKQHINTLISCLLFSGLITSIFAIYQHFTGFLVPDAFWANRNTYRVTAWYGFPNAVGLFLAPLIPLAMYFIVDKKNAISDKPLRGAIIIAYRLLPIAFIPLSILAILFAKSLGSLIAVAIGIALLLILRKQWKWLALGAAVLGVFLLALGSLPSIPGQLQAKIHSGSMRVNMWAETIEFLRARPLRGAGLASYRELIYPYRIDKWIEVFHHPHNIFLTMWVNLGLLGVFSFIWILVWFYRTAIDALKHENMKTLKQSPNAFMLSCFHAFMTSMTIWLVTGLADSPYIKNDLAILFWLLPALLVASPLIEKGNHAWSPHIALPATSPGGAPGRGSRAEPETAAIPLPPNGGQ